MNNEKESGVGAAIGSLIIIILILIGGIYFLGSKNKILEETNTNDVSEDVVEVEIDEN